ncbi:hypothetical protein IAU60_004151 [Kwoniella sp. DSM 27419]
MAHDGSSGSGKGLDARTMLSEIGRGTAGELAMAVRYTAYPPGPTFVDSLDRLILEGRPHPGGSSLQRGDLVELVGPSGSGKTSLLTFFLLTYLLPAHLPDHLSTPLGGRGLYATLIQPTSHRAVNRSLKKAMVSHIYHCAPAAPAHLVQAVLDESLDRLTLYRPRPTWKDYALCLRIVLDKARAGPRGGHREQHTLRTGADGLPGDEEGGVDLLVMEGMGDPFYPQRWSDEERLSRGTAAAGNRTGETLPSGGKIVQADRVGLKEVMAGVGRVRKELGATVMLSTQGLRTSRESQPFFIPHLPPPYPAPFAPPPPGSVNLNPVITSNDPIHWPLNIQITLLGKVRGLQYPGELTLPEALQKLRLDRFASGHGAKYEGIVRMDGAQGVIGSRNGARFRFDIGPDGVSTWEDGDDV